MRNTLIVVLVALAATFFLSSAAGQDHPPKAKPKKHWALNGCKHGHTQKQSRRAIGSVMRSPRLITKSSGRHIYHYAHCTHSAHSERRIRAFIKALKAWRSNYATKWHFRWLLLPQGARDWTTSTGACESGNNPTISTGNGFRGAFQWVESTWRSAGGDRDVVTASWHHQAVLAWFWHLGHPRGQWPRCGE